MSLAAALERVRAADRALQQNAELPLPLGNLDALVAGAVSGLDPNDWWLPGLREQAGGALRDRNVVPPSAHPALRALVAVGLAAANPEQAALVHLGVGSLSDGAFHEALNLAALLRVNVVFLVAVHPLDGDAPLGRQTAASAADLARAYGIGVQVVDATDAAAVQGAVRAARDDRGPNVIEARLPPR